MGSKTTSKQKKILIMKNKYYGYIYKITCNINKRCYVGQHRKQCFDEKYWGSGNNKDFKEDIKKYGKENFTREILAWCYNQEELNEKEMFFIEKENALTKNGGYNLWINKPQKEWSPETIKKFNKNFYKAVRSKEYREKQRQLSTGRKHSKKTREKISNSLKNSTKLKESMKRVCSNEEYRRNMSNSVKNSKEHQKYYKDPELRKKRYGNLETRKKISIGTTLAQIGKHWFNNGIVNRFAFECPDGFKPGRLYKRESKED